MSTHERRVYQYRGSVLCFGREVCRNWVAQTTAVSEKEAISNLLFRAKKELGLVPNAKLTLSGKPKVVTE